jgi:hypothetical protein
VRHALGPARDRAAGRDHDHLAERAGLVKEQAGRQRPAAALSWIDAPLHLHDGPAPPFAENEIQPQFGGLDEADGGVRRLEPPRQVHTGELFDERAEQRGTLTRAGNSRR